jgi:hypothetical protein
MAFTKEITTPGDDTLVEKWIPTNNIQDLWNFVIKYFYSLHAKEANP